MKSKEGKIKTITLNGEEYVKMTDYVTLKEEKIEVVEKKPEPKEIKRFPTKTEQKLLKCVGEVFTDVGDGSISEEEAVDIGMMEVIDPANVALITAKTDEAKRLLSRFCPRERYKRETDWDFIPKSEESQTSKFSLEYINKFMKIMTVTGEACKISMLRNHPIQIENEHFACIVAPRVENEDE